MTASVMNAAGEVIAGAPVTYSSSSGSVASVSTGGLVTAVAAGTASVQAAAGGKTSPAATITVVGPGTLTKQSTDPASVVAGAAFGSEIRVRMRDGLGAAKAGVAVTFAVTAGGGSVSTATVTTDASGDAATVFTTGKAVGINTATATAAVAGVAPVTFSITTIAGPPAAVSFASKVAVMNVGGTLPTSVTTTDANGNAVTGATLTFLSRSVSVATVSSAGVVSGIAAGQAIVVASSTAGADSMLAVVAQAGGPVLMTDLASFTRTASTDFVATVLMDMRASNEKLGSASVKLEWDPAVVTYQSHASGGGPTPTVNTLSVSSGTLSLSLADANGYAGQVPLLKVTFKAAAAGKAGLLRLSTSEVFSSVTFTNLTAKTTAVSMPISTK